jgi:hypothetical protein
MMPALAFTPNPAAPNGVLGDANGTTERGRGRILAKRRVRADAVTCDDCFFRRRNLCALDLDEPCPTFRPDTPDGLVPPRQPSLLTRSGHGGVAAVGIVQPAA